MTAKRPNKPKRLSTLPATLTFNDYSDYEGAPESSDFRALPYRLSTLRLCPSDFGAGRHTHPEALADRSGQHPKKSPGPNRTRPDRLRPCLDQGRPHDGPQKPPQTGAPAAGYTSPAATGTAHRGPRGTTYTETERTQTTHASAGKQQDERKIKPGEITPGKRKCSTEPPRRRHGMRRGGRRHGSKTPQQGRTPTRAKRNPPEALPPAGMNYLSRALSTAPQKISA